MRLRTTIAAMAAAATLGGCTVGPNFKPPQANVPADWQLNHTPATTHPSITTEQPVEAVQWWKTFNDPQLDSLVSRAAQSNLDLLQAAARLRQARAARGIAASAWWPSVNGNADYSRSGTGRSAPGTPSSTDLFRAGLDAAWEIDVFGGTRRSVEAADANIQAAVEDQRGVLVSVVAEVALNYLDLRALQQQIAIAQDNLTAQQQSLDVTRKRFRGGFVSRLDVANAEAQVATTRSQIPLLEASRQQTIYALSLLVGKEPMALVNELSNTARIPATPPVVPVGLPSDLVRRRPDIRLAEAQLHAATANIGVAVADLFPKFSLTGALSTAANQFSGLGNWSSATWSVGPGITWQIFDGGRIRANIQVQDAIREQALLGYERVVLSALSDVHSALVAYAREQEHRQALAEAVTANQSAVELSTQLYTQGQTDFLNVLQAQRALLLSQDALVQSNRNIATDLVALYKALGGGWEQPPEPPADPAATQPAAATG